MIMFDIIDCNCLLTSETINFAFKQINVLYSTYLIQMTEMSTVVSLLTLCKMCERTVCHYKTSKSPFIKSIMRLKVYSSSFSL